MHVRRLEGPELAQHPFCSELIDTGRSYFRGQRRYRKCQNGARWLVGVLPFCTRHKEEALKRAPRAKPSVA